MSHITKSMKWVPPRIEGLSIAAQDNNGLRFGCGVGLRAGIKFPPMKNKQKGPQPTHVARGTAEGGSTGAACES